MEAVHFIDDNFKMQGYQGAAFIPWPKRKKKDKLGFGIRKGEVVITGERKILVQTGNLRRSFKQTNSEDHTTISTDIPYARIHNEGGDIRHPYREVVLSYRGKTGALKLTKTNTETQQRKVTALRRSSIYNHITHMPQRQFMPITQSDTPVLTRRCESVIIRKLTTALKS